MPSEKRIRTAVRQIRLACDRWTRAAILAVGVAGCASGHDVDSVGVEKQGLTIRDIRGEVNPRENGPAVRVIYEYLRQYGYFPNPELEKQYPYWAPLVPDASPDPQVYGPELEEGVSRYQSYVGLPKTGRVDTDTLRVMQQPRCGHPENEFATRDPSDQWALLSSVWSKTTITYRVTSAGSTAQNGITQTPDLVSNALNPALAPWRLATFLTLQQITTGTPDVEIKYWPNDGTVPTSAQWVVGGAQVNFAATAIGGGGQFWGSGVSGSRIGLNDSTAAGSFAWASTTPPTTGKIDIQEVLQHEIGHTLGFDHSSAPNSPWPNGTPPIMFASTPTGSRFTLQPDDRQAASSLYQLWQFKNGVALDIGAGGPATDAMGNPLKPNVYATSTGNTLWYWTYNITAPDFGTWNQVLANAIAIAVDDNGVPWAVSSDNTIWQGSGSNPLAQGFGWTQRGDASTGLKGARDIAASGGQVWIISNQAASGSPGNFVVEKWTGTGSAWDSTNSGVGIRIAADWKGRPWVVQANTTVWRFYVSVDNINQSTTPTQMNPQTWQQLTQARNPNMGQNACANDIASGLDHSVWVIGCTASGSNFDIWIWDEQVANAIGSGTPSEGQFIPTDGYARWITASADGRPWVAQAAGSVYRRSISSTQL